MADKQKKLEHTDKNAPMTTKDATDLGVPVAPGEGPQGPEDAMDPHATTRGDYTGRLGEGESYVAEPIPPEERVPGGPIVRMVRQK